MATMFDGMSLEEVASVVREHYSTVPLSEREAELEQIARDYSAKPLLVAIMELIMMMGDVPIEKLKYLPEKFRVAQA